jgi:hypothetical protein
VIRVPAQPYLRFDTDDYSLDPSLIWRRIEVRATQCEITAVVRDTGELAWRRQRSFAKHSGRFVRWRRRRRIWRRRIRRRRRRVSAGLREAEAAAADPAVAADPGGGGEGSEGGGAAATVILLVFVSL